MYFSNYQLAITVPMQCDVANLMLYKTGLKLATRKKLGFTLAETLITLTIIGVIAAITIPTLVTNYQKQTYVTGLQKAYSNLQNAMKMIPINENCSSGDFSCVGWNSASIGIDGRTFNNLNAKRTYILSKQFKIARECTSLTDCHPEAKFGGDGFGGGFVAQDGTIFVSNNINSSYGLSVDINGLKGPNLFGRDIFRFEVTDESKNGYPEGLLFAPGSKVHANYDNVASYYWNYSPSSPRCSSAQKKNSSSIDYFCAARVLEEGKMNY